MKPVTALITGNAESRKYIRRYNGTRPTGGGIGEGWVIALVQSISPVKPITMYCDAKLDLKNFKNTFSFPLIFSLKHHYIAEYTLHTSGCYPGSGKRLQDSLTGQDRQG